MNVPGVLINEVVAVSLEQEVQLDITVIMACCHGIAFMTNDLLGEQSVDVFFEKDVSGVHVMLLTFVHCVQNNAHNIGRSDIF